MSELQVLFNLAWAILNLDILFLSFLLAVNLTLTGNYFNIKELEGAK